MATWQPFRRRTQPPQRWDDRLGTWAIVATLLGSFGGAMLLDVFTELNFSASFYRQATWPFSELSTPGLAVWLLTGAAAIVASATRWPTEGQVLGCRIYGLWVLAMIGVWYGLAGFVFGVLSIAAIVVWTAAGWWVEPRGGAPC